METTNWKTITSAIYDFFRNLCHFWSAKPVHTWGVSSPYRILNELNETQVNTLCAKLQANRELLLTAETDKFAGLQKTTQNIELTLQALKENLVAQKDKAKAPLIKIIDDGLYEAPIDATKLPSCPKEYVADLLEKTNSEKTKDKAIELLKQLYPVWLENPSTAQRIEAQALLDKIYDVLSGDMKEQTAKRTITTNFDNLLTPILTEHPKIKALLLKIADNIPDTHKTDDFLKIITSVLDIAIPEKTDKEPPLEISPSLDVFFKDNIVDFFTYSDKIFKEVDEDKTLTSPAIKSQRKQELIQALLRMSDKSPGLFQAMQPHLQTPFFSYTERSPIAAPSDVAADVEAPAKNETTPSLLNLFTTIANIPTKNGNTLCPNARINELNFLLLLTNKKELIDTLSLEVEDNPPEELLGRDVKIFLKVAKHPISLEAIEAVVILFKGLPKTELLDVHRKAVQCTSETLIQAASKITSDMEGPARIKILDNPNAQDVGSMLDVN